MSPWLFNIYMDGVMREVKGKVGKEVIRGGEGEIKAEIKGNLRLEKGVKERERG